MDQLMRFLFKHERAVFTKGQFAFDTHAPVILLATISLLVLALVYYIYIHPRAKLSPKTLTSLVALRILFFAFFIFLLLRPVMIVSSIVPRSTDVAVLVDDSQSMLLPDEQEAAAAASQTRLEAVKNKLFSETSSIWKSLNQKFQAKLYGFSEESSELISSDALAATGARTDIATALESTVKRSTGRPLSAIVLITDGAHNGRLNLEEQLRQLRSRNVPVFTVGVGSPNLVKDVELMRVNMPRRSLVGSAVHAETLIRTNGYSAGNLLLSLREDGRTIKTRELKLDVNSEVQSIDLDFTPSGVGMRRYTFALTPLEGELTLANNAQEALLEVSEGPVKVLYIEGEPRWEYGKLRTSLTRNEKNVSLISFLRSGENKFYRQGIENEGDLAKGFPITQDELFAYQGLILGSVEAGFFSTDQLKNIEAFVARRGGGLLALGGRRAFSGGQFGGTPLADLLPLALTNSAATTARSSIDDQPIFKAQLTSARAHSSCFAIPGRRCSQ
ncbi:MAG: vWA domain-containing protein [Pyrinomonadaceae bacterium]